jgi:TetR/AcrR family transcriptional regulator, repressor of fatR-cypB operon
MNIHSYIMARTIDNTKLEGIKQNAVKLIVEKGYGGASISNIAKKAKVAEGYLYRFYKSKEELVSDLLNIKISEIADNLEESIQKSNSFTEIIELLVQGIFEIAEKSSNDIMFLYVMMNDYSFSISSKIKERIAILCRELKEKGKSLGQIDDLISEEEIYMFLVIYPIQFINLRIKKFFGTSKWTENDIEHVIHICNKSLKK